MMCSAASYDDATHDAGASNNSAHILFHMCASLLAMKSHHKHESASLFGFDPSQHPSHATVNAMSTAASR